MPLYRKKKKKKRKRGKLHVTSLVLGGATPVNINTWEKGQSNQFVRKSARTLTCRAMGSAREGMEPLAKAVEPANSEGQRGGWERLQGAEGVDVKCRLPVRKTRW